jgi:hypothetical protein
MGKYFAPLIAFCRGRGVRYPSPCDVMGKWKILPHFCFFAGVLLETNSDWMFSWEIRAAQSASRYRQISRQGNFGLCATIALPEYAWQQVAVITGGASGIGYAIAKK